MNHIEQIFNFEGQEVRTVSVKGDVYFVAKDVSDVLGFRDAYTATRGLDEDEKLIHKMCVAGQFREVTLINESGLYELIFSSRKKTAKDFKRWIKRDVLPSIRKNKVYIDPTATDQEIDNAVRFATPQKRRNLLMSATIDGENSVFAVYGAIKEYISKWTAEDKIKALNHVERTLLDKKDTYGSDIAFVHKIEELLRHVAKDLDKIKNWKNGAEKRELGKENKQLQDQVSELLHIGNFKEVHLTFKQ
ncbi:Bro-N domain-containing protein [Bacillus velezensis]|uniref:BRO-N domain-containing protein n=1 Tax=Bacillus velezensis TaxID=492670 RepID=UPI003A8BDE21